MDTPASSETVKDESVRPEPSGRPGVCGVWLFLLSLSWFMLWGRAVEPTGDERETLEVASGLFYMRSAQRLTFHRLIHPDKSKYGIGQSLVDLPGLALERLARLVLPEIPNVHRILLMQMPGSVMAALAALLLYAIGRELNYSLRRAAFIALAAAASSPLWDYSRTLFADLTVAVCLLGAVWSALRFETGQRGRHALFTGAFLAFGAITKFGVLVTVPFIGVHLIWAAMRNPETHGDSPLSPASRAARLASSLAMFGLPLGLAAAWILYYNHWRYGAYLETGYWNSADQSFGFSVPIWVGLYGMFFSSGKSVFLYTPLLAAALFGWASLGRRRPGACYLLASASISGILFYACWWAWHGDWSWGNRHILYATLLGLIPLGELRLRGPVLSPAAVQIRRSAIWLLFVAGFAVNLLGVVVWRNLPFYLGSSLLETPVFKEPLYVEGSWEIRDDFAHFHFIPEFSPLATHLWLARAVWNHESWTYEDFESRAPWMALNKQWRPQINIWLQSISDPRQFSSHLAPEETILVAGLNAYDVWWHVRWVRGVWSAFDSILLMFLILGSTVSGILTLRHLRPRTPQASL